MDRTRVELIGHVTELAPGLAPFLHLESDAQLHRLATELEAQRTAYADMGFEDEAA